MDLGTWGSEGGRRPVMMSNRGSQDDELGVQEAESPFPDFTKVPTHQIGVSVERMLYTV